MRKKNFNKLLNLNNIAILLGSSLWTLWFCIAEPTSVMAMDTQPDSVFSFTAEELKAAQEISPEELMRQIAENAAEIEKLESEEKCSDSSDYEYRKAPRQKKNSGGTRVTGVTGVTGVIRCDVCEKVISRKGGLKKHMQTHSGEKSFPCPTCGKTFNDRNNRNKHEIIHTGKKPFKCSQCEKAFSRRYDRKRHELSHTRCGCKKSFKTIGERIAHIEICTQRSKAKPKPKARRAVGPEGL